MKTRFNPTAGWAHRTGLVAAIALLGTLGTAWAAFDAFLQIDGIPGDATDAAHRGQIVVQAFSASVSSAPAHELGARGAAARATFGPLRVIKLLDPASPRLWAACAQGQTLKSAVIECVRPTTDRLRFYRIELTEVRVVRLEMAAAAAEAASRPVESVDLSYGRIAWTYTEFAGPSRTGTDLSAYWDLVRNQGGAGTGANSAANRSHATRQTLQTPAESAAALPAPSFRVSATSLEDRQLLLTWPAVRGRTYQILASADLVGTYTPIGRITAEADGWSSATVPMTADHAFFLVTEDHQE
ncbi:MAG: type VI secretion system tube protein Hcp [Verrucomicrobia bacterium]|nr:type VI secretion system tube protein Hcp [Verrucomicrobiota bacterium]